MDLPISNGNEDFQTIWCEKIEQFSLVLMEDTPKSCKKISLKQNRAQKFWMTQIKKQTN